MGKNPFGDSTPPKKRGNPFEDMEPPPPVRNPFGDEPTETESAIESAARIENSARKIRSLRSQLGAEGLTYAASRELIDEVATALEAAARALRSVSS